MSKVLILVTDKEADKAHSYSIGEKAGTLQYVNLYGETVQELINKYHYSGFKMKELKMREKHDE